MTRPAPKSQIGFAEFVALLALCMSMIAMSIDTILPALPAIGQEFGITRANSQQFMITALFIGLSIGQLIIGPLSDSIGRKRAIYIGLSMLIVGSILSYSAPNYEIMLLGRFIQGLGGAAPRVITLAIVRDQYEGRRMARVMSFIMGVFIIIPALAPTIGQGLMMLAGWHSIFLFFILMAMIALLWMRFRLVETLHPEDRRPFTPRSIRSGIQVVCGNKVTICYTISAGFIFGGFLGYLNSSQQVFQSYYDSGALFPLYFGMVALSLSAASFINARIVEHFGMRYITRRALIGMAALALVFAIWEGMTHGIVPLPLFLGYIMLSTFCMGMSFGNMNALAMEPMGHYAGIASAVVGAFSTFISVTAGAIIGQMYNDTLIPLTAGFLIMSTGSLLMMVWAEHHERQNEFPD